MYRHTPCHAGQVTSLKVTEEAISDKQRRGGKQAGAHAASGDIECWNCGKNHFAYQCTEPPNVRDPEVQKSVNAIDDPLRGTGQYSTQDITEQFETLESATSYIAHVRKATEEMVRVDHSECDVTNAWPAPQVQIAAVQQQQSQYSNINATRLTCRNMATNMPVDQMTLL